MLSNCGNLDWRWFARPGETVFDIGANIGGKAGVFLDQGLKVVCVEPQPSCVAALRKRFKRNRNVTILPIGVADKPGVLPLSICSAAHTISTFSSEWKTGRFADYKWDKVIEIPVITIDELIRQRGLPAYCKIDVEGFEVSVLKGLTRPVPLLSFEFAEEFPRARERCIAHLQSIGFRQFNYCIAENPKFVSPQWLGAEALTDQINQIKDPKLWGDIYAYHGDSPKGTPPPLPSGPAEELGMALRVTKWLARLKSKRSGRVKGASLDEIHHFNQKQRDQWVAGKAATVLPGQRVLDIGAGTCPYRPLFSHCEYLTQDFKKYEGVKLGGTPDYGPIDYVSEITHIPLPDASVDVVLSTEVLEHVPEPIEALREMARLLKPGGRILLTAPLGSGLHQLPFHFYGGFTPEWYVYFSKKFGLDVEEITPNGGFFKLLSQECARFAWTFDDHQHHHGKHGKGLRRLFGDLIPRYLFALDDRHCHDQFTVGYHVALKKPAGKGSS